MVNCNPETVSHRLRHQRSPLLRAAHLRGRHQRHRGRDRRPAGGTQGDRVARRPDPAQAGRSAAARADRRHLARVDRPRRGPREVERAVRRARDPPARRWHGHRPRAGAQAIVDRVGYPVLVRPSYVLGGRAMQIVYDDEGLARAMAELAGFGSLGKEGGLSAERPVLVDRFLEDATEVDVDAIRDHTGEVLIGGSWSTSRRPACTPATRRASSRRRPALLGGRGDRGLHPSIADALDVRSGLINVQYAVLGTRSSSSRPTPAPAAPCRSWPRPPACRS
jgi:hypothetical protein